MNNAAKRGDKSESAWYTMKDKNGIELAAKLNVIFIDLLTIKKLVGTPVEKLTPLQKWGLYLSYADDESETDYVNKIVQSEDGIMEANRIAEKMSEDDAYWFRQNSIDTFWRDYYSEIDAVKKQGAQQKAVETAANLKTSGVDINIIAKCVGLSVEEVKKL